MLSAIPHGETSEKIAQAWDVLRKEDRFSCALRLLEESSSLVDGAIKRRDRMDEFMRAEGISADVPVEDNQAAWLNVCIAGDRALREDVMRIRSRGAASEHPEGLSQLTLGDSTIGAQVSERTA